MIVVDSSVWIDFFNGVSTPEVDRLDALLGLAHLHDNGVIHSDVKPQNILIDRERGCRVCVYYCRTFYKAVRVGEEESGGHVL